MKAIKEILTENLINLRKAHKMTQSELGSLVGYSDKAISRWEHGEVLPDIETLEKVANVYNVPLTFLLTEQKDIEKASKKASQNGNKVIITMLSGVTVWFIATIIYIGLIIMDNINYWQIFVLAVPISCIIGIIFSSIWARKGRRKMIFAFLSIMLWSLLAYFFLHLSIFGHWIWMLFLLGIPLQIAIILALNLKHS
ncbi:MAG: helix-turn-helix domain-containing protein [Clostridia bacterium]|nr:helix-turn-helix domain-containing protein [Clostridia bacterium]